MTTDPITRLNAALEGRYRIEREIGEGGMATVYLAEDLRHERKVALKVLKPELAAVVGAERFLAEIKTTANLQHPHILPLFDSGQAEGILYYVMPYIEGDTLQDRIDREKQLPIEESLRIASDIAEALDHAHRNGVVHRDIKPANILLADGRPLIADFGIALAVAQAGGGRVTETGLSVGTPHYMSPEQATGDRDVDPRADVYALGSVLYEMLAGEPPYSGATAQAVLARILTDPAPAPTKVRVSIPPNVDAAIRRALEKLPADRFAAARDFARALGDPSFRWGEPSGAGAGLWNPLSIGLAAVTLVLVGTLVASSLDSNESGTGGPLHTSVLLPRGRIVSGRTSMPLSISADGQRIVVRVLNEEGLGETWLKDLSQPELVHLSDLDGDNGSLSVSPDGAWIAFNVTSVAEVQRASTDGGSPLSVAPTGLEPGQAGFSGITYGPDGSIVLATTGGLRRIPEGGGSPEVLTSVDADGVVHGNPAFLPDGSGVLFVESTDDRDDIMLQRFAEDSAVRITEGHSPRASPDGVLLFGRGEGAADGSALWAARLSRDWMSLEGTPAIVIDGVSSMGTIGPRLRYALAENGTLAYMPDVGSSIPQIVSVTRDGAIETILDASDPQFPPGLTGLGRGLFSPDGRRIAIRAFFQNEPIWRIFTYDIARGAMNTVNVELNADWPVWAPDGERIAFNRFAAPSTDHNLYWARADNAGTPEPLLPDNPYEQHAQDFSPDGRYMVYTQREVPGGSDSDLWVWPMDGTGGAWEIVGGPGLQRGATVSPDGRWMAFVSDESGQDEVYLTDFPESADRRVKISTEAAANPVWGPSGDELFFMRLRGPALMSVPISTAPLLDVGVPEELFTGPFAAGYSYGRSVDVHPDGETFLMVWRDDGQDDIPRIELIQNFLDLARERLGEG